MALRSVRAVVAHQTFVAAPADATAYEASVSMKQHGKGALLVLEGQRLVGIVTERDIVFRVVAAGRDPRNTSLEAVMTPQPQCIEASKPFLHALRVMRQGGFRHVPVIDNDRPIGVVSARDALDDDFFDLRADLEQREDEQY
ncbi:MAG: CBS domain-containing protein [Pseudomonadota bacterium]|nr:CBS domain-containing protein [Pseudomonadota bacterium]